MGMGLYICRRLVEVHGGRIWVESQLAKGSVFHVALPRGLEPGAAVSAARVVPDDVMDEGMTVAPSASSFGD
jgi:hypothetical protein